MTDLARALDEGERLLRARDVRAKTSLSDSTIARRIKDGTFPAPVKLGGVSVRWLASEVDAWIASLPRTKPGT